jgi:hypothetical protein
MTQLQPTALTLLVSQSSQRQPDACNMQHELLTNQGENHPHNPGLYHLWGAEPGTLN